MRLTMRLSSDCLSVMPKVRSSEARISMVRSESASCSSLKRLTSLTSSSSSSRMSQTMSLISAFCASFRAGTCVVMGASVRDWASGPGTWCGVGCGGAVVRGEREAGNRSGASTCFRWWGLGLSTPYIRQGGPRRSLLAGPLVLPELRDVAEVRADPVVVVDRVEIAVAAVGQDHDDGRAGLDEGRDPVERGDDRARGAAREYRLAPYEPAAADDAVQVGDPDDVVGVRGPQQLRPYGGAVARNEPGAGGGGPEEHAADRVDRVDRRTEPGLADVLGAAPERAPGTGGEDEVVDLAVERLGDLPHGREMGLPVERVGVLVRPVRVGCRGEEFGHAAQPHGQQLAGGRVGRGHDVDLGPVGPQDREVLRGGAAVDHADEAQPEVRADLREADREVPGAGLDHGGAARHQLTGAHAVQHHRERRAVLDTATGVEPLGLGDEPHRQVGREPFQLDERGSPHGGENSREFGRRRSGESARPRDSGVPVFVRHLNAAILCWDCAGRITTHRE
ncbi:putative cysteine synthase [Streptomyces sp. Tu6071]|nr:putative cysteine synthase [Streptomyces sp. Tu6071]